jgi:hypothetical protein
MGCPIHRFITDLIVTTSTTTISITIAIITITATLSRRAHALGASVDVRGLTVEGSLIPDGSSALQSCGQRRLK